MTVAHAGDEVGLIGLNFHATTAAKSLLSAPELVLYCVNRDGYAGKETCRGLPPGIRRVGLARRFEPEHVLNLLS